MTARLARRVLSLGLLLSAAGLVPTTFGQTLVANPPSQGTVTNGGAVPNAGTTPNAATVPDAVPTASPEAVPTAAPTGGGGLFVGVNEFADPSGKVGNLRFAVNDAIEQCHLFALELRLIPPANCTLALSGEPEGEPATAHLAALQAAGATVVEARKSPILIALSQTCAKATGPSDLLIVACSSHGFSEGETAYLMPKDGLFEYLADTAVQLATVEGRLRLSTAGHRMLLVDACQNRVSGKKSLTGAAAGMSPAFAAALAQPTGQVKLASCDVGQFSLELPTLQHGVFTAALLEALRGGAADADGLIRLNEVEPAMTARVAAHLAAYNRDLPEADRIEQSPTFHGPATARRLPLAVPATDAVVLIAKLARWVGRHDYTEELHARVSAALAAGTVDADLRRETERFAERGGTFFAIIADRVLPPLGRAALPMRLRKSTSPPRIIHQGSGVSSLTITPDGLHILSGSNTGRIHLWDLTTGRQLWSENGYGHGENRGGRIVQNVAVTPDGRLAISGAMDGTLLLRDLATGKTEETYSEAPLSITGMALTPNGRYAVSGCADRTRRIIRVRELASGSEIRSLEGHSGTIKALAITPDGRRVVSGSYDHTLRVWNLETGQEERVLKGHDDDVSAVAITPDGQKIVSGSLDNTLRVWDLASGRLERSLIGHGGYVYGVAVTPDARWAVSGSFDNTLRVWNLKTGREERVLSGHQAYVSTVAITPDGRRVVSGSSDDTLRVWDLFEPDE